MGTSREVGFGVATISFFLVAQLLNLGYATDNLIFKLIFYFLICFY